LPLALARETWCNDLKIFLLLFIMLLSLVITTYNRYDSFLEKTLKLYLENPHINEIVILDDCSDDYGKINANFKDEKLKVYKQEKNVGTLKNKINACQKATGDWICLMDSDNFCDITYFEALKDFWNLNSNYNQSYIYHPSRALPAQNFEKFIGIRINKENWNHIFNEECLINNGNYVFHRSIVKYVEPILIDNTKTHAIDVKYMNYFWIKAGISIVVVPNMIYNHTIHPGSFYINTHKESDSFNQSFNWKLIL